MRDDSLREKCIKVKFNGQVKPNRNQFINRDYSSLDTWRHFVSCVTVDERRQLHSMWEYPEFAFSRSSSTHEFVQSYMVPRDECSRSKRISIHPSLCVCMCAPEPLVNDCNAVRHYANVTWCDVFTFASMRRFRGAKVSHAIWLLYAWEQFCRVFY